MNSKNFKIKQKAVEDMGIIADFIAKDNKSAAVKLLKAFSESFNLLSEHPLLGKQRKDFTYYDVRFYVVKKHYLIVYQINDNMIEILRVLTSYQDICNLLS